MLNLGSRRAGLNAGFGSEMLALQDLGPCAEKLLLRSGKSSLALPLDQGEELHNAGDVAYLFGLDLQMWESIALIASCQMTACRFEAVKAAKLFW